MQQAMQQLQGTGLVPPGGGGLAGLGGAGQTPLLAVLCLKDQCGCSTSASIGTLLDCVLEASLHQQVLYSVL